MTAQKARAKETTHQFITNFKPVVRRASGKDLCVSPRREPNQNQQENHYPKPSFTSENPIQFARLPPVATGRFSLRPRHLGHARRPRRVDHGDGPGPFR